MAHSDAQLVGQTLRGEQDAFGELVNRHQTRLLAAALHLVGDRETAQDLAQEAFVEAYRGLGNLEQPGRFAGWLYGILRNRCRRHLSRRAPQTLSWEADAVPEPTTIDPEPQTPDILPLLSRLPQDSREILAARYLHDMTYAEIAGMLGISVGNVRVKCFRARQALRDLLAADALAPQGGGL